MDAIYFDLDGTLTDPKIGITRSIQYALDKLGHPTIPSEDELTWCIGPPLRASFTKLLGHEHSSDLALQFYRERFADIGIFENSLYAGISDILTALARPGRRLVVATSKPGVFAHGHADPSSTMLVEHAIFMRGAAEQRNLLGREHALEHDVSVVVVLLNLFGRELRHCRALLRSEIRSDEREGAASISVGFQHCRSGQIRSQAQIPGCGIEVRSTLIGVRPIFRLFLFR